MSRWLPQVFSAADSGKDHRGLLEVRDDFVPGSGDRLSESGPVRRKRPPTRPNAISYEDCRRRFWPEPARRRAVGGHDPEVQADFERKAQICADLFQRTSSCVQGRNGHVSLKYHALHRFTSQKLRALTVLHNCLVHRTDGTTGAERFYRTAPRDEQNDLCLRLSE